LKIRRYLWKILRKNIWGLEGYVWGEFFFMKEALPERLYFVYCWGEVLAAGSPDGDYVGLDEGQ
jgi:hypothetical protein